MTADQTNPQQGEGKPRRFTRWADEGGIQISIIEKPHGALVIAIEEVLGGGMVNTLASATMANFRRDHLLRWLQGENV